MARIYGLLAMVVLGIGSVFVGPASPACACSCVASTEAEHESRAEVIFEGDVQSIEDVRRVGFDAADVRVKFVVHKVSKGELAGTAYVVTARDGASCGAQLKTGTRYRIYARSQGEFLTTSLCSGNRELDRAAQNAGPAGSTGPTGTGTGGVTDPVDGGATGGATPPMDKSTVDYRPIAAIGGGLVAVAGGLLWFAKRRRAGTG